MAPSPRKRAVRGATVNSESTRFGLPTVEADGDWLDLRADIDGTPAPLQTTVTIETPRTIITRNISHDVFFDRSINPYRGCDQPHNGCAICGIAGKRSFHWRCRDIAGSLTHMKFVHAIVLAGLMASGCSSEAPKACSPPRSSWGKPRSFGLVVLNRIALDRAGRTYWNGTQVSRDTLDRYLALGPTMNPEPWVFLETEMGASCTAVEAIRDKIEKHVDCLTGYRCNEGIKTIWDHTPSPPGTPVSYSGHVW